MSKLSLRNFIGDESGGGTIMGLFWFILLVGICGLAVDTTDGLRNRTMLQATADSAALAGVIDLPNESAVKATAVAYSALNMGTDANGSVLRPEDVTPGVWDHATRTFTASSAAAPGTTRDAVHVMVHRSSNNNNPLPVNFLRIIGLQTWNIRAQAIAQRYVPECTRDGFIAGLQSNIESDNDFYNNFCLHGQTGVNLQNHNDFESGTNVTMPNTDTMLEVPSDDCEGSNTGLCDALSEANRYPRLVNRIDEIMASLIDETTDSPWAPSYITSSTLKRWSVQKFDAANLTPGTINYIGCPTDNNLIHIPAIPGGLHDVVIIADCRIQIAANALLYNVVIGSRADRELHGQPNSDDLRQLADITSAAGAQIGLPDNCADGGEAILLSNGSMNFPAQLKFDGAQLVARNNIDFGANGNYFYGISAQAGRNITLDSQNKVGLCPNPLNNIYTVWYYRLVL